MLDFRQTEKEVLEFWEKEKIYDKIKKRNKSGKKFYFLQGPPYTSGKLHIGHAWNNSLKDMIMRYKRMKGFNVWDRGGYDMHGLPTENAVQKKLKLKSKEAIEKFGVGKFVKECMDFSTEHAGYMNEDLWKLGIWMNHKNAYMPIKKEFIDGEWAFFKEAWKQNRLYKGKKVMHWDAQSETSLAKHELEYKNVRDDSIFLKFKKRNTKNEYFIIWTTTPWTIPYNLAIMVNPDILYVKIKVDKEVWVIAKDLASIFVSGLLGKKFEIVGKIMGKDLEGEEYEHPLHDDLEDIYEGLKSKWNNVHTIILSKKYVDTSAGSGLVHCAPGCGPEDQEVAAEYGIGAFNTLNEQGEFENMGKFSGWVAKEDDKKFVKELKESGSLVATTPIEHEYPHSWRSHKPVVFRTTEQWFLKTGDLVKELLEFNKDVKWVPKKSGESYERWANNLKDNGVTRQRFWGCPVPIWNCECGNVEVIGGVKELEKKSGKKFDDLSLHKPWIDKIKLKCECGKNMKRIPDVADVWLDSGTASWNCLYNDEKLISEYFPADLVLEATEQTKLWFSLLQICSSIMFKKSCYKNVFTHGMILDYQGTKMSKSLGNVISPYEVIDKYSVDIFRYYICEIASGENINFSWEDIKVKQRNLGILFNVANYILDLEKQKVKRGKPGVEERWIVSRYNSTLKKVSELFESYRLDETISEIEKLFMSLSRDYIKLVREKSGVNSSVLESVEEIYFGILKMFAPVCPFISDYLWRKIGGKEKSVHLSEWPKFDENKINKNLEEKFEKVFAIIEKGLAVRDKERIGLKWPLSKAEIYSNYKLEGDFEDVIAKQLNVKNIEWHPHNSEVFEVKLDSEMNSELEAEGYAREFARRVQAERKKAGLEKGDVISLKVCVDSDLKEILEKHEMFLLERTNSKEIEFVDDKLDNGHEFSIKEKKIIVSFS